VLTGEHDLSSKETLRESLATLIDTHKLVVADLSVVQYIDSTVLGELALADRNARIAGRDFRLQLGTEPIVKRVLEISGLLQVLDWYPTRDAALGEPSPLKQPDRLL
jgi:stage II sporulation protein AA (anti-sigma F factor antagonist)